MGDRKEKIFAKALDGQQYPLPLCECKKYKKIKKDLRNHSSKTINYTEFCLVSFKRELALS